MAAMMYQWQRCDAGAVLHCDESFTCDDVDHDVESTTDSSTPALSELSYVAGRLSDSSGNKSTLQDTFIVDHILWEQQETNKVPSCYLHSSQAATGLTAVHRATVVDNMIAAAARLGLNNDILFTAVAILDRYLAKKPVLLPLLQPSAIACLWVASKYEQLVVPPVAHYAMLVQGSEVSLDGNSLQLSKQMLVELEGEILAALDYRLASIVTVKAFKGWLMQQLHVSQASAMLSRQQLDQLYCMTSYLTEVSLLEYKLLRYKPSQVASAAFVYAHMLLGMQPHRALHITGCTLPELAGLLEIFCALHNTLSAALHFGRPYNVTAKYRNPAVCCVANVPSMTIPVEQRAGGW